MWSGSDAPTKLKGFFAEFGEKFISFMDTTIGISQLFDKN